MSPAPARASRRRSRLAAPPALAALAVYLLASFLLFGLPLLGDDTCVCLAGTTDQGPFAWALQWWPHAVLHGTNPFYSHLLYAPYGIDLAHGVMVPAAAVALAPVTALASPLTAFNVGMLLSPPLAAFFAFLLCRRLTRAFWPSLLGGWLFGFSTYMLGQLTGHLTLTLVFAVPAIVHLVLRLVAAELSRRRFLILMVLALLAQFGFSPEVLVSTVMFGVPAAALAWWQASAEGRAALRAAVVPVAAALGITALLVAPYLYYAAKPGLLPVLPWRSDKFSNDLTGFVLPTQITQLGGTSFLSTTRRFSASFVEGGAYLGLPLLALVAIGAWRMRRRAIVRVTVVMLGLVALLSLGGRLNVAGHGNLPLPWAVVHRLPVVGQMLPARFALYATLCCALIAALWLAAEGRRVLPWALALLSVASLWPAVGRRPYWHSRPDVPALFTAAAYRHELGPRDTVLALPIGIAGQGMLWQAQARLRFAMAGGYIAPPEAPDPYKRFAVYPTLTYGAPVPGQMRATEEFLRATHVTVAVLDEASAAGSPWPRLLEQLGWQPRHVGGALLLRPTPAGGHVGGGAAAVRAVAARSFSRFAAGDALGFCATLTAEARGRLTRSATATPAACAAAFAPIMRGSPALRAVSGKARIGAARVTGTLATVTVRLPGRPAARLPARLEDGRWLVDGSLAGPAGSS